MEMLLMILCMSIFGLAVTALAFGAATRPAQQAEEQPQPQPQPEPARILTMAPARFFAHGLAGPVEPRPAIPIEALLLQIESHVRLEHAAAESFLDSPTSVLLHTKTASPFLN